jgi:hypothetical protein
MNELQFPYQVRHYLDQGTERMDRDTARRLHGAREKALAHVPVSSSRLGLAGLGQLSHDWLWPALRSLIALLLVVLGVAATSYWDSVQQAAETEEVDTALLADELPIDAYLDRGFDAWLKHSSPQ